MSNNRRIQDATFVATRTIPAANASNQSASFDLGTIGSAIEAVQLFLSVPALPALADTKSLTVTVQDSADNSSFATLATLATHVSTGAGGVGAAAKETRWSLPTITRRYIRLNFAVDASGGDNTGVTATVSLRF